MNEFWKGKRVLITGGTGFLGKYLAERLQEAGAMLKVLDYRFPISKINNANFYESDIRDKEKINFLCKDTEFIFHLAAMPSIARGKKDDYYSINVGGTENIMQAAYNNGVKKIIHVSSSTVYGIPACFPLKEDSPTCPIGKYGKSKLEAENVCRSFISKGMDISIIRPRVIIGPGRIGIFSILFNQVAKGGFVYILGKGDNIFQFTHVEDMVDVCLRAAKNDGADLFNVGSSNAEPIMKEISELIRHANSKSTIIKIPAFLARFLLKTLNSLGISPLVDEQFMIADKNFKLDTAHAQQKLNWSPCYSNLDSLLQAYDWYISNINKLPLQYKNIFSVFGKFKSAHMGGFQN